MPRSRIGGQDRQGWVRAGASAELGEEGTDRATPSPLLLALSYSPSSLDPDNTLLLTSSIPLATRPLHALLAPRNTSVGDAVKTVQVGDLVALEPGDVCRRCYFCQKGQYEVGVREGAGQRRRGAAGAGRLAG